MKLATFAGMAALCLGSLGTASSAEQRQRKVKKPELPPLPAGPTGPVPQVPLDSISPVSPQVSYHNGELTIVAPNSTLGDILRAVRKQTGAEIEIPAATDRVVTRLGPGPARDVMVELLNGSRFNYVLVGSPADARVLTRVVLVAKTGTDTPGSQGQTIGQQQALNQEGATMQDAETAPDAPDQEQSQGNAEAADQATTGFAHPVVGDQVEIKTPQEIQQELQERQLLQQQTPGQPPVAGPGVPPQPPQQE